MDCWLSRYCGGDPSTKRYECENGVCSVEPPHVAQEYIITIIIHEFISESRHVHPGILHNHLKRHYPQEIAVIAAHNHHKRKPPTGRAGRELSNVILRMQADLGLPMSHRTFAKHQGRAIYDPEARRRSLGDTCPTC